MLRLGVVGVIPDNGCNGRSLNHWLRESPQDSATLVNLAGGGYQGLAAISSRSFFTLDELVDRVIIVRGI